jgi:hypothetical protein
MRIHAINDFAADVPTVFGMLTDPVFLRATCLASEPLEHSVSVEGPVTRTRRVMPTPSVVARLAGPTMAVVDQITWQPDDGTGRRAGDALITVEGLPARLVGTVRLEPGGRGAVLDYDGELTVDVPFLGPSLAKQAAPLLLEALEIQQRVGDRLLAR